MKPESIRELFEYHYWASQQVWDCIMVLTDEQFVQPLDYSVGSIRNHMIHLMSTTQRWIKRLQLAQIPAHLVYEEFPTRAETKAMWEVLKAATLDYIYSLDQPQLDEIILWDLPSWGKSSRSYRWEILLHVANHGTDHRAQILAALRQQFSVNTIEQDLIFYLAESD